ncbi:MAG: excinuclease ABC subunit A, partial [Planctomycetaceae bacterium]
RDKMSVFCGPSGSGKSSLAMDTLYAEGQRRYVESLSSYARQFLGQMPKPRVEHIHGLSPAIAIEQKATGTTPRSTVGTVTEIYDYLRVFYARLGTQHCPDCNIPIETQTVDQVIDRILELPEGTKLALLAPQEVTVGQKYEALWQRLQQQGYLRVRINGETHRLEEIPAMDRRRKHVVEVVVDRVKVTKAGRSRLADSVEAAFALGQGMIHVAHVDDARPEPDWQVDRYSLHFVCGSCGRSFEQLSPHHFSFNAPLGWCAACEGLGTEQGTNLASLIADPRRPLKEGAIAAWPDPATRPLFADMLDAMAADLRLPLDVPYADLEPAQQRLVLYGTGDRWFEVPGRAGGVSPPVGSARERSQGGTDATSRLTPAARQSLTARGFRFQYKGLFPAVEEAARVSYVYRQRLQNLVGEVPCSACHGSRLRDDAAAVRFQGKTIQQACELPMADSLAFLQRVKFDRRDRKIAVDLLHEATSRLSFLVEVGLHYLTLARTLPTLSGGEMQRIRLAGQIGRALTGVLYVLDEPTIGLHPRDNGRLLEALRKLRDLGNTLVLVEHDREILEAADRLYDFGPGAGRFGGNIVGQGTPKQLGRGKSLTGKYLSEKEAIPIPKERRMASLASGGRQPHGDHASSRARAAMDPTALGTHQPAHAGRSPLPPGGGWLELLGAKQHNLRDVDLRIPLGTFTCVTGVSGSGKSSLIEDTLAKALSRQLHRANDPPGPFEELIGIQQINKVITVDQQPLGSTPASNPATYTGVFDEIRELFTRLPEAKVRGYRPGRFSFNRPGGRCEDCEGNGQKRIEMHFLPDVWIECETCRGKRYNAETLAVKYRGRSIADVLEMSIGEAAELFDNIPKIRAHLATLCAIGLEYLTLGQPAPTLSGGEAQRVKLAAELARPQTGKTLYILDEPTTGLHFDDIRKLLRVLDSLVEAGNTVVVIEHNLDVIKTADWVIDLGPDAGHEGGWIVAEGTPEDIVAHAQRALKSNGKPAERLMRSYTGEMLAPVLKSGTREAREIFDAQAAAKKRSGDVDLHQIGRDSKMPWQIDGRRWHTVDRVSHQGRPCRWEGDALGWLIDRLEEDDRLAAPDWSERTVVEVKGTGKQGSWFLHALTGDEWLLTLRLRVKKGTFDEAALSRRLGLKEIDDLDDLHVYGRAERVRVKAIKGPYEEITITVHWLREIDTPEFRAFLAEAIVAFAAESRKGPLDLGELTPWKVLGRKWHLSRKGFPTDKRVAWNLDTLETLLDLLQRTFGEEGVDWGNQQVVNFRVGSGTDDMIATVHTKRRGGIDLTLFVEAGTVTLGRIADLGHDRVIKPHRTGRDRVSIRIRTQAQVTAPDLAAFLSELNSAIRTPRSDHHGVASSSG